MPWLIQHVCNPGQEPQPYAIMRGNRGGVDLTRVVCPVPSCREEFYIMGHEMFSEATSHNPTDSREGLPPGFVIAHSRKT